MVLSNVIIVIIFFITSFVSLRISYNLSLHKNNRLILTPVLLFTLLQIFMVNIGVVILTVESEKFYTPTTILMISTLLFNCGAFIIKKGNYDFLRKGISIEPFYNRLILIGGYIITCFLIMYILQDVIVAFKGILLSMIGGEFTDSVDSLAKSRKEFTFGSGGTGLLTQLRNVILTFLTILILSTNYKKYIKIIVIAFSLFFILSSGQRWPLFEAILVFIVYKSFVISYHFSLKKILLFSVIIYFVLFVTSYVQPRFIMVDDFLENAINNVTAINYRLFVSQAMTSYYVFDLVPTSLEFGHGAYIIKDFSTYLPGYQEGFSTILFKMTHSGKMGSASFSTLTLFFADFGYFSIIISFVFGALVQAYTKLIYRGKKSTYRLIFHSFVIVAVATAAIGSVAGIISHGLLSGFFLYTILRLLFVESKKKVFINQNIIK